VVIKHAAQLLTIDGPDLGIIEDGALVVDEGKITWVGTTTDLESLSQSASSIPQSAFRNPQWIDASGCVVMPGFVDCHTHLVFGGWRDDEFEQRLEGRTYKEIQQAGGGILATVRKTRAASEDGLFAAARERLQELLAWGTTTCEIKSGYGLDTETELKMLRVIRRLQNFAFRVPGSGSADSTFDVRHSTLTIAATFLGAHSVPPEMSKADYIELLVNEMIPEVGRQKLAQFCDVFCENFVFNAGESRRILEAGRKHGMTPKIHADEIETSGGAETAAAVDAISAEHLLVPSDAGLQAMQRAGVIAALLPGTSLFLKTEAKPPVARMRELGLTFALGSDFNPGSCTLFAMPAVISLACLYYGLTIKEAIAAATINSARALDLADRKGSLMPGKDADILILDIPNYRHIAYRFAHNPVRSVVVGGRKVL
jgi:imidazolonepropionase